MPPFETHVRDALGATGLPPRPLQRGECQSAGARRCRLCVASILPYEHEIAVKNSALESYWIAENLPGRPDPLLPSPQGRSYRTVTKRKVFTNGPRIQLGLIDPGEHAASGWFDPLRCVIEPETHTTLYREAQRILLKPQLAPLAENLRYVILKGNYDESLLIFSVGAISGAVTRAANDASKALSRTCPAIAGVFLYLDETKGGYYLGTRTRHARPEFRKIYGAADIAIRVHGRTFRFPPLSFTQVNQSILEALVGVAGDLLAPDRKRRLVDLYCGYGLFALSLAGKVGAVTGVEVSPDAVGAAGANARRLHIANTRFLRQEITQESVVKIMEGVDARDLVLLDPPRSGPAEGVIEGIAARRPARVLHIFCDIDLVPAAVRRWHTCGYSLARAVPLDMFPGISGVELLVLFTKI